MNKTIWKPTSAPFRKFKKKTFEEVISTCNFIYQIGETSLLRQVSKHVVLLEIETEGFKKKVAYLKKCLIKYRRLTGKGRGITGVQVGIPERFSVIYMGIKKNKQITNKDLLIIINPKITKKSEKLLKYPEICMSANPIIAPVVRPSWIEFEYLDENGQKQFWNKKDDTKEGKIYNRVFQHEIDHMDGIICIDKVDSKDLILESDPNFYKTAKFEEIT